jgi:RNA polymerase sigma-70 factor (ECF subfamily)
MSPVLVSGGQGEEAERPELERRGAAHGQESDGQLMQRYRGGDLTAFELLYRRHRAPLCRFIAKLARDYDEADEIFQEVWTAVIQGRRSYRPTAKFSTYLFSIAHRRLQDRWRRSGRRAAVFDDSELMPEIVADEAATLPEKWISNVQLRRALLSAIDELPHHQREVFLLKAETDLSLGKLCTGRNECSCW